MIKWSKRTRRDTEPFQNQPEKQKNVRKPNKFPYLILQRLRRIAGRALLFLAGIAFACVALETYLRLK